MTSDELLQFIEPGQHASSVPVIDEFTRRICAAFRKARHADGAHGGIHECYCGAASSASNYILPGGAITNSLCIHYVGHHRSEVPPEQLERIGALNAGEAEPNERELAGPDLILSGIHGFVERRLGSDKLAVLAGWGFDKSVLCRGLQGGCLPAPVVFTPSRQEAEDLFSLLTAVVKRSLPSVEEAVKETYGDLKIWAGDALRIPGFKREAWVRPLLHVLRSETDVYQRRAVAMCFGVLRSQSATVVPALSALEGQADDEFDYAVGLALRYVQSD